jgi:hypothetical protein
MNNAYSNFIGFWHPWLYIHERSMPYLVLENKYDKVLYFVERAAIAYMFKNSLYLNWTQHSYNAQADLNI